jgi:hypothetical protein
VIPNLEDLSTPEGELEEVDQQVAARQEKIENIRKSAHQAIIETQVEINQLELRRSYLQGLVDGKQNLYVPSQR